MTENVLRCDPRDYPKAGEISALYLDACLREEHGDDGLIGTTLGSIACDKAMTLPILPARRRCAELRYAGSHEP